MRCDSTYASDSEERGIALSLAGVLCNGVLRASDSPRVTQVRADARTYRYVMRDGPAGMNYSGARTGTREMEDEPPVAK